MNLGIVILAAGQGMRMRSNIPKVLHSLAGKPLLGHVLDTARQLQPQTVVVVYGHGGEQVRIKFADAEICWAEQAQRLGTGHAVQQAISHLHSVDQVLILYGDVPLIALTTLEQLLAVTATAGLGIITAQLSDPSGYGRIIRDEAGRILRIVEHKDATSHELTVQEINTGILVANREQLTQWLGRIDNHNAQGEFYLTDIISLAVADDVKIASIQPQSFEEILGVNDRLQLAHLERYVQLRYAETLMRAGVTLADPKRFDVRGSLHTGIDVTIDVNVIIEGTVVIESGVSIGPNCVLRNCHISSGTEIYANSVIDNAKIGSNTKIGPFARIRPGTELAASVHIGNFVELKNAHIGTGSKINHLTYMGDCQVGSGVNVGAGTITCNYDGAHKHQTVIEDDAFIGSNTALVAPVTVGKAATIGAGSVITKPAPAELLTVSRASQQTFSGWRRPKKS